MRVVAEVLPVDPAEVAEIAAIVRQADRDEIERDLETPIEQALLDGITGSRKASKIVCQGLVLAVFGDADCDIAKGLGVPWLISTVHVERFPRAFLAVCKPEVEEMLARHGALLNYVACENTVAIRWLRWLGFDFHDAEPYGPRDAMFYPFTMTEAPDVRQ